MSTLNLAEEVFIDSLVRVMNTQAELMPIVERLNVELSKVATANEAVLRDQGITEKSPLDDVLATQDHYVNTAIERSGMPEDHRVVRALRAQQAEMAESFRVMAAGMDAELGRTDGPSL